MIDEAIRRCLRYAIGTCVGLGALVYVLDPDRMATIARPPSSAFSEGGSSPARDRPRSKPATPPPATEEARPEPLRIRAPSGVVLVAFAPPPLGEALKAAAAEFRQQHGGSGVLMNLGSTPEHCQELAGGRYADLVIGAGPDALAPLVAAQRIPRARPLGRVPLALAVPRSNPAKITSFADLARPGVQVSVAAPSTAVGALTRRALDEAPAELRPDILANVVAQEEDPSQVLTRLGLGSVHAGFVLRSDLSGQFGQRLREVPLPASLRPDIPMSAAVLPSSERLPYAQAFLAFLESSAGQRVLGAFGVEPAPSS